MRCPIADGGRETCSTSKPAGLGLMRPLISGAIPRGAALYSGAADRLGLRRPLISGTIPRGAAPYSGVGEGVEYMAVDDQGPLVLIDNFGYFRHAGTTWPIPRRRSDC